MRLPIMGHPGEYTDQTRAGVAVGIFKIAETPAAKNRLSSKSVGPSFLLLETPKTGVWQRRLRHA